MNSQPKRQPRKRKHEYIISALKFKKQKTSTENSILELERHLQRKTCPKSIQYKAKTKVTSDRKWALLRVTLKANIAESLESRSQNNVMKTREKQCSPFRNIVNTDVSRIDILKHQLSELKDLICTRFQSDNKHVEKYNSAISEQTSAKPTEAERLSKYKKCQKRRKDVMQRRLITEKEN